MGRNLALLLFVYIARLCDSVAFADSNSKAIGQINFTLSSGLDVVKIADDSLVQWPISAVLEANGDLLVLECHWERKSVQEQLKSRPHKIVRLSDTDRDSNYDQRKVIADELGFPEGIMKLGADLLVTVPPQILQLSDKDADGFFESKKVWFDGGTLTHCANDLHGPMIGPDGWVYWTKGAFAEQIHDVVQRADHPSGKIPPSKAAHIYRRHPNGGPIDRLMTGGMDNPSDLTFSPEGEIFFCSTFFYHPGNGLRDGIAHAPRGGLFGKPQSILETHWKTGPLLEPIAELGPAAPASIQYISPNRMTQTVWNQSRRELPTDPDDFLISAQFNFQKVALHRLIPSGASFVTESRDLLSADRIDFHPVKVIVESDESLLVFDTGGWYDLCCPSSGSDQSIARGGIYRLKLAKTEPDSNGVGNPNLSERDHKCKRAWEKAREITNANDTITQTVTDEIIGMLSDPDASVQQTAAKIVGVFRWKEAAEPLVGLLTFGSAATVRVAMESLGIVGDARSVRPIISAMRKFPEDRYIEHSALYALLEIGAVDELTKILVASSEEAGQEVELYSTAFTLKQLKMFPSILLEKMVPLLASQSARVRDISLQCLTEQPEGIAMCLPFIENAWKEQEFDELNASLPVIRKGIDNSNIRSFVGRCIETRNITEDSLQQQNSNQWLLSCIRASEAKTVPSEWIEPLSNWLKVATEPSLIEIANTIRAVDFQVEDQEKISLVILERIHLATHNPGLVLHLLAALPPQKQALANEHFQFILNKLENAESSDANLAIEALARHPLSSDAVGKLIESLVDIAPLHFSTVVDVAMKNSDTKQNAVLLNALVALPGVKTLSIDRLLSNLKGRPDTVKEEWKAKLEAANRPPEDIARSLDQWLEKLPSGDASHGYEVFRSAKAACSSCHQVGYIGGQTGPELSRIGKSRNRRDLIEAIVFPSIRIAQGFQPIRVLTTDGEVFNGLVKSQTESYIDLICGADKVCRVPSHEIEEQIESNISIMPGGLQDQISLQDFADLIAYLESRR